MRFVRIDVEAPSATLLARRYGVRVTPTYLLVDRRGRAVWRQEGGSPEGEAVLRALQVVEATR
ncbi:MAG: thioredoxin family protein [Deltaproteobacteria bacterium]|nr:thioredoxin family protein [Deltaproteobacteria bacterium]